MIPSLFRGVDTHARANCTRSEPQRGTNDTKYHLCSVSSADLITASTSSNRRFSPGWSAAFEIAEKWSTEMEKSRRMKFFAVETHFSSKPNEEGGGGTRENPLWLGHKRNELMNDTNRWKVKPNWKQFFPKAFLSLAHLAECLHTFSRTQIFLFTRNSRFSLAVGWERKNHKFHDFH